MLHMKILPSVTQILNIKKLEVKNLLHRKKPIEKDLFIKQNSPLFNNLSYKKSTNLKEAATFAEKNFGVQLFDITELSSANQLNQIFTKIYNVTRGKAEFPPIVSIINKSNSRFSGYCGSLHIEVIKNNYMTNDIIHEIGHYNHQKSCSNYWEMGKLQELIDDGISDHSIYEQFAKDKKALKLIKKHICPYATSSPAEFVACTFNAAINGKKLPAEIQELYKKYEGPFPEILKRI